MSIPITPEEIAAVGDQFQRRPLVTILLVCLAVIAFLGYVIVVQEKRLDSEREKDDKKEDAHKNERKDQYDQNLLIIIRLADAERSLRESVEQAKSKKK